MVETLKIKKLSPTAISPRRATEYSAGYDLYADLSEPVSISPGEIRKISTGIALQLPVGTAGFIFARSSLATKHGVVPANCVGVVDSDYRGQVFVPLQNHGSETFVLHPGDRFAQIVILPVMLLPVEETEELEETQRGEGGFGSTGTAG